MKLSSRASATGMPIPNYIDPVTRGHGVMIVNAIFMSLAVIVVALRLYTRLYITATPGLDDILIVLGLVFGISMAVVTSIMTEDWGHNRHLWDVPLAWFSGSKKLSIAFQITFAWSAGFAKTSLLWFCRRLLGQSKGMFQIYKYAFLGAIAIVATSTIAFTFATVFQCSPAKAFWTLRPTFHYTCFDDNAMVFGEVHNTAHAIDLEPQASQPPTNCCHLDLRPRSYRECSWLRPYGHLWKSNHAKDVTWLAWPVQVAAGIEISLGLICSSAPALRPLLMEFMPRLLASRRNSQYPYRSPRIPENKLWSSSGTGSRSYNSRSQHPAIPRDLAQPLGYESDRFEIMRTVEMETWPDSKIVQHAEEGLAYPRLAATRVSEISADSPVSPMESEEPTRFSHARSSVSSRSFPREI
ncbi:hypothetical protein N7468_008112 [Penicillium chermesinum]|uniref:Rhodopsin domain-containing protein n=1 Tax=Penicillium chermesinum TaxID=63820 RepID=A0A9W9NP37_9EURO|nr:uncharacterized protein N7468_008112 [Penicillium chermesinum]KAJ5223570.1 hypothetical protein N7468_008112 [Penicillium chermesinum]